MKSKARVNRSDNTTVVEYFRIKNPYEFRYKLLKSIISGYDEAAIFLDTNSKAGAPEKNIVTFFEENDIEHKVFLISKRERKFFGFSLNSFKKSPKPKEKFIIAKIVPETFTKEFFNDYIKTFDIAVGINPVLSMEEMALAYRESIQELYFNKEYFKEFTYDSILFSSIRSTIDIADMAAKSEE